MDVFFSEEFFLSLDQISIRKENIHKALEVPPDQIDPYVDSMITDFIRQTLEICSPRSSYALYESPVFVSKTHIQIKELQFALDKIVLSAMKHSSHLAIFIGTAGEKVEQLSKKLLKEGHSLEGLIVDLIGSEIAEGMAEFIHKRIETDMADRGLQITNRYSPGYCNWPVSDQQNLFKLIDGHTCGVQLTASSLMLPIKSVSGIVGVGPGVKNRGYTCSKCDAEFCIYRDRG